MDNERPDNKHRRVKLLTPGILGLAIAGVLAVVLSTNPAYPGSGTATASTAANVTTVRTKALPTKVASYLGVHEGDMPASYALTKTFKNTVGKSPNIVLYYSGWPENFRPAFARTARSHGAVTLVDIDPSKIPLTSITDGSYNWFIDAYAAEVKAYGHPVMLSFGHEMNGTYYSWGSGHSTPAQFIAAWRYVVKRFRADGAGNVTWVWTVNAFAGGLHPVAKWYPGNSYVNWVAMDGYIYEPTGTFDKTFGPTLKQIRKITNKPVFISETAVGPKAGQVKKIPGLFAGVKKDKLLGLLWFDKTQNAGIAHQNWRIEDNKKAAATFRSAMKKYYNPLAKVQN